jgi:hypothetical protein
MSTITLILVEHLILSNHHHDQPDLLYRPISDYKIQLQVCHRIGRIILIRTWCRDTTMLHNLRAHQEGFTSEDVKVWVKG